MIYKSLFANGLSCYIVNYIHLCVCDNIIDVIYVLQHSCDFSEVKPTMVLIHAFCSPQAAKEGAFPKQKVGLSRDKRSTGLVTQALSCQSSKAQDGVYLSIFLDISRYSSLFLSGLKQPVQPLSPGSSPQCGRILCQDVLGGDMAPFGATCSCWNK